MKKLLIGFIVAGVLLLFLSAIDSAASIGEIVLAQKTGEAFFSQPQGGFYQHRLAMIDELNKYRQRHGLQPLQLHTFLMQTAQWWSEVQAFHGEGGHPEAVNQRFLKYYKNPVKRSGAFCSSNQNSGTTPTVLGINSAARNEIYAWAQSPGHNKNQLNPAWRFVGAGLAVGKCEPLLSKHGSCFYSTMDFAG